MDKQTIITLIVKLTGFALILAMCVFSLISCRTSTPVTTSARVDSVYISTRDTLVRFAPDTATARLLLACDSAGHVLIQEIEQLQGERTTLEVKLQQLQKDKIPFSWAHKNDRNVLEVICKTDSLEQVIEMQRVEINRLQNVTTTDHVRYIPAFYKNCTAAFIILCVLVFIYVVAKIAIKLRGL